MWNHSTHLEAYFGIPAAGGVLHPINLRLHPNELAHVVLHAGDRFLIVDDVLLPIYESFCEQVKFERVWVVPQSGKETRAGSFERYEDFLTDGPDEFAYPQLEEHEAAAMCFTSRTTGNSKAVLYSHRALVLHSFAEAMADTFGLAQRDVILPVAPMFHANAWGVPFTATMVGTKLAFPGPYVDPESLLELIEQEHVTVACSVPTLWIALLDALEKNLGRWKISHGIRLPCGGTAPPEALIRGLDRYGFHIVHLWGMTETTPLATAGHLKSYMDGWPEEKKYAVRAKQGRAAPFVELRVMTPQGEAPWDGQTVGELEVRGPWVAASYSNAPETKDR